MNQQTNDLKQLVDELAVLIEQNQEPDPQLFTLFLHNPELAFRLIDLINTLEEEQVNVDPPIYSACLFGLDICVAQLQTGAENHNKAATKVLAKLMNHLATVISYRKHSLSFWLPILNAFYEVHVELSVELKSAYRDLANQEEDLYEETDPYVHLNSIRDVIQELADLSIYDIAENFFAQSYAMPAEFFADLVIDLYSIDEGHDIALLTLLHPKLEVREIVVSAIDQLIDTVTFTSNSLSRLEVIKSWYPPSYLPTFNRWIKIQRKKGVVFAPEPELARMCVKATEVDGTSSQGIFIHVMNKRKHRLCGLLLKFTLGIKDVWLTPTINSEEVAEYYDQAFDGTVTIREVNAEYLQLMVEHFLAVTVERGNTPDLHFLEIQELLGIRFKPKKLDVDYLFEQLSVQIMPFTQDTISKSLKRSKSWLNNKEFTESWYLESSIIDKIVNHNSSFVEGVKICRVAVAMDEVFTQEMELHRAQWQFHFLWMALWSKVKYRKNEKIWEDCFLIAYCIRDGIPLKEIPIMKEICYQTVINSVETMLERKTYLSKE